MENVAASNFPPDFVLAKRDIYMIYLILYQVKVLMLWMRYVLVSSTYVTNIVQTIYKFTNGCFFLSERGKIPLPRYENLWYSAYSMIYVVVLCDVLVLYIVSLYRLVLYSVPLYRPVLYSVPLYRPVLYSVPLYRLVLYSVPLYRPVLYSIPLYRLVLYIVSLYRPVL